MTKSPGQAFYDSFRERFNELSGLTGVEPAKMWFELGKETKTAMEHAAKEFAASVPPKEIIPQCYVDARPLETEVEPDVQRRGFHVQFRVWVPEVEANHARPGDMRRELEPILQACKDGTSLLRLAPISTPEIQSELARLNRDGTVREFAEEEGTW